jgi:hypothetical protein
MLLIEAKMADANRGQPKLMTHGSTEDSAIFGSVLRLKSGRVPGLGDLELLSTCDLSHQTGHKEPVISMAVSADVVLNRALLSRTQQLMVGPSYEGGTDATAFATASTYWMWREARRTKRTNARQTEHQNDALAFVNDHLESVLS